MFVRAVSQLGTQVCDLPFQTRLLTQLGLQSSHAFRLLGRLVALFRKFLFPGLLVCVRLLSGQSALFFELCQLTLQLLEFFYPLVQQSIELCQLAILSLAQNLELLLRIVDALLHLSSVLFVSPSLFQKSGLLLSGLVKLPAEVVALACRSLQLCLKLALLCVCLRLVLLELLV